MMKRLRGRQVILLLTSSATLPLLADNRNASVSQRNDSRVEFDERNSFPVRPLRTEDPFSTSTPLLSNNVPQNSCSDSSKENSSLFNHFNQSYNHVIPSPCRPPWGLPDASFSVSQNETTQHNLPSQASDVNNNASMVNKTVSKLTDAVIQKNTTDTIAKTNDTSIPFVDETKHDNKGQPIDDKETKNQCKLHPPEKSKVLAVDYASKSAGAIILEKSANFQGTSNLLNYDQDKYAIVPCDEPQKFVVVGLSEDILVKQVSLANYERYSSHIEQFNVLGSITTAHDWVDLGTYNAKPLNGKQLFDLERPSWVRYLKFQFLSHHGDEHYCIISQITVHGITVLQGFYEQWEDSK